MNPASGETEAVALVALPSPHVYQGAAPDDVMHGGARGRGGRVVQCHSKHHVGQAQGRGQRGAHHPPCLQVYGGA